MKKIILSICLFTAAIFSVNAQGISKNAIGLRFGDNSGLGAEISYQHLLKKSNRLELDLGLRDSDGVSSFKLAANYQWVWDLKELSEKMNWYAGFGGGLGSWKKDSVSNTAVFASGTVGIEYNFDIPLLLSLDIRPEFGFSDAYDGLNSDIALGIRYQF
ncbi:hypothetical protein [Flavicella sediminum]|uniref:hypothetical protein n=1 Tax=Flavicella sediminum TaxID=2585141 RepID=UPI00111E5DD1|nr:hypothetical protein [Flavicella sediminum]